jgi:peroxiredoxin
MVKSICMLAVSLTMGQLVERGDARLTPQLPRGQELVYTGTYLDEALAPNVNHQKWYRLETTLFVLEASKKATDVAIMTALTEHDPRPTPPANPQAPRPTSVRFEMGRLDIQGRLRALDDKPFSIALNGPPTLEFGFLVEVPLTPVGKNTVWDVTEEGRPTRTWQVAGTEACTGITCLKLVAAQQSPDWDQPRADQTAWRRKDVVWLAPQLNVALKVERTIERRDPAHKLPTHRFTVRFELESKLRYPGKMYDDRKHEIEALKKFHDEAGPLLTQPALYGTQLDSVLQKVAYHLERQPATPYRKAVLHFKQGLEAARRGDLPPDAPMPEDIIPAVVRKLGVGERMPDFVLASFTEKAPVHLKEVLGQPTLVVFYNPSTAMGRNVLLYAKDLCERHVGKVNVLAMALTASPEAAAKQHAELRLPFPVLDGHGLRLTLAVEHTPRFVLLDAAGVIRWEVTGWGDHVPGEIAQELRQCLK